MRARSGSSTVRSLHSEPCQRGAGGSAPTQRIYYERSTRTFRLYARSTLYAFHVDDGGR